MSTGDQLATWLEGQRARVEGLLAQRLADRTAGAPDALRQVMAYAIDAGGKRLRPILCLAWCEAAGGNLALAEDAAVALEWIHTYSLIHDDLPAMDDDALRRGKPTCHIAFGEAMAILAGDALLTEAFALLARGPEPQRAALVLELATAAGAAGMVGGQVLDIAANRPAQLDYLLELHARKTGALLRAACRLGALSAGPGSPALGAATAYGESVGLCFQIVDDLLDVTSSPEVLGKPTGADARAQRPTFPAVLGLEGAQAHADRTMDAAQLASAAYGPWLGALARYVRHRQT